MKCFGSPSGRPHEARRLLLPRTLARESVGRRRRAHARGRHHIRAHRRVRLEPHRARARPLRVDLARPRDRDAARAGAEGRDVHAHGHAAEVAGRCKPRCVAGRRGWPCAWFRFAPALLFFEPELPCAVAAHHARRRRTLRATPRRRGLADRQRVRLPRHRAELQPGREARLSALAANALHDHRGPERSLGHGVLEPGVPPLRRGRSAGRHRHRSDARASPRPPAL